MPTIAPTRNEMLRRAHESLLADLRQLSNDTGEMPIAQLHGRLLRTKRDISEHFRLEEENGYLDFVLAREPNLGSSIDKLREDHQRLLDSLDELLANLNQTEPHLEQVREQCRLWAYQVRDHEIRENDLIQDAFLRDIGSCD